MIEKEFKWNLPDAAAADKIIESIFLRSGSNISIGIPVERDYTDRYYDTKEFTLYLSGFGCRLRVADKERLEVKFQPKKKSQDFLRRNEWLLYQKDIIPGRYPRFEGRKVKEFFLEEFGFLIPGPLIPIIQIKTGRKKWMIEYKGVLTELSFDNAAASLLLKTGTPVDEKKVLSFKELELESVKEGKNRERTFRELGALISDELGEYSLKNKLERSLSYYKLNCRKVFNLEIKGDEASSLAIKKIISHYFEIAKKNLAGVEIGIDNDYIHDMRVAVRKMRTALPFFRYTMTLDGFNYLKNNLRWIALVLGSVRDMDVFSGRIGDFVPPLILERNSDIIDSIKKTINSLRDVKRMEMLRAIQSYRFRHFISRVEDMIKNSFLRNDYRSISGTPTKVTAKNILKKCSEDVIKYTGRLLKNFESASDSYIHKLRIRYKRLRYAIDFFSGLFEESELKISGLIPPIQDVLGLYVDTFFMMKLTAEVIGRTGNRLAGGSLFILNGISAAIEDWKKSQREKIFAAVNKFADSRELADFMEGVERLAIR